MPAAWAGERIRTSRQLFGLSQTELAEATGFSQAMISAVEAGTRPCSDELVGAVVTATGIPARFFDVAAMDLPPGTLRYRKLASARVSDTKRVQALLGEAYRVTVDMFSEARLMPPRLFQLDQGPTLTADEIEAAAAQVRGALGIGADGPIAHVTRRCEKAGVAVVPLNLPNADAEESETVGHFGASCWPSAGEAAVIGVFPGGAGDRQRFTVAHELGHLVLHGRRRIVDDPEGEANRFAGALLMPAHRMEEALGVGAVNLRDLAQMKARWGISIQALIMRGAHLGLIDESRKVSLYKQLSARGWRKSEPVPVGREEPALMWELLRKRFGDNPYQRAADELGLPVLLLRSLAPAPAPASPGPKAPSRKAPDGDGGGWVPRRIGLA